MPVNNESADPAIAYHLATKHHFRRLARSLGYLDWDTQPDPFRRFDGAPVRPLKLAREDVPVPYDALYDPAARSERRPVDFDAISYFFELALALSAWKQIKTVRWALRMNPSSGNLHPTEGYVISGPIDGLHEAAGVYHYAPKEHALERRTSFPVEAWQRLVAGFPSGTFFVGLSSIHWREAWKYGERAYRYCQHDAGHALAALCLSAGVQGWRVQALEGLGDEAVAALLGLDRAGDFEGAEGEHPDLIAAVMPDVDAADGRGETALPADLPREVIDEIAGGEWVGRANALSHDHVDWDIIDRTAEACVKPEGRPQIGVSVEDLGPPLAVERPAVSAARIIRQRRSAVALDGRTGITAQQFYLMMDRVLPRAGHPVFDALRRPAYVHLGLFVHLVEGIPPGLYCLVRRAEDHEQLRAAMRDSFVWEKPPGCPAGLPLYLLMEGDCRAVAWKVSCDQQIAGAGAYSLGMIGRFEPVLREHGAWMYRRLHWETGMIGQLLYLEAEAAGIRGTGIGCFFDDPVHQVFGLGDYEFQTLYHFTIGGPVEDTRLTTLPPYAHLKAR